MRGPMETTVREGSSLKVPPGVLEGAEVPSPVRRKVLATGPSDLRRSIRKWLTPSDGRTVHLVGVGNPIRGDDGVGLEVARALRRDLGAHPRPGVWIHPPAFSPERLLSKVSSDGGRLTIFDAVEASMAPGALVFAHLSDTKYGFFATHNLPMRLIPGLAANLDSACVLGVQPGSLEVREGLSESVSRARDRLVDLVKANVGAGK